MASIALAGVRKVYTNGHVAVHGLDLEIADGELMVLVGPSGSGKSTALRLIAGLETPTGGTVHIGGDDVTAVPPQERDLAMVFQSYALYPHKTVRQNLAFPLRMHGVPRAEVDTRVQRVAASLGLETMLDRKPAQLSGGQRQRVALGRAAVREPRAFLFDEPLSNLDPALRVHTRAELALLHRQLAATMVYVTHDQEEAMTLGDRIAVLKDGELQQVAPPLALYREPANIFVAGFIGSPAMNLFEGVVRDDDGPVFACDAFTLRGLGRQPPAGAVEEAAHAGAPPPAPSFLSAPAGSRVTIGIRPQDVRLAHADEPADARGTVTVVEPLGSELRLHVRLDGRDERPTLIAVVPPDTPVAADDAVGLRFPVDRLHLFESASGERIR
jgi:multiple sugar transport system ATP-binding protein